MIICILIITGGCRMSTVRVDNKLLNEIKKLLKENGNKYKFPTVTSFINNSIYEKLAQIKREK